MPAPFNLRRGHQVVISLTYQPIANFINKDGIEMRKDEWDKKGPHIPSALGCKKMTIVGLTALSALVALLLLACGGLGI